MPSTQVRGCIGRDAYQRYARRLVALPGVLITAESAVADGGISALGAMLDGLLLLIGFVGLPVIAMMLWAVGRRGTRDRIAIGTGIVLALTAMYVLCALFFYLVAMDRPYAKFPGAMAAATAALLLVFAFWHHKAVWFVLVGLLGIPTGMLLVTPASFWKGNAIDVVETVFVDNSAEIGFADLVELPDSERQLLKLSDGRLILQFERDASGAPADLYTANASALVTIEEVESNRASQWFDVTQYQVHPEYLRANQSGHRPPGRPS